MTVATVTRRLPGNRHLLLGAVALCAVAAVAFAFRIGRQMPDFEVYWRASARALAGEPLYRIEDGHWLFKYLPVFAVLLAPVALLPVHVAKAGWFLATLAALVSLLRICLALLPDRRKPSGVIVAATLVVMSKFYLHELLLGQSNLLLAAAVASALLAMQSDRERAAGGLIVLAVILKPYAVILLPWLLARGRREAIVAAAIGMAGVFLIPIARYGLYDAWQLHRDWWHTVVTSTEPNLLSTDNVSWLAMYSRWLGVGAAAMWLAAGTALVAFGLLIDVYRRRHPIARPEFLEAGLLLTLMPLLSPQGWDYALLVATPLVCCLVNYERELPSAMRAAALAAMAVIGLTVYDVMGRRLYLAFLAHSGITLAFFVIIAAAWILRRRQVV